jgi:hypothetical protein
MMAALRYGGSMLAYLVGIYFGGGLVSFIGVGIMRAGSGGPFGQTNPGLFLLGVPFLFAGYIVMIAGTLGLGYKVIADGVRTGLENSAVREGLREV